MKIFFIPFLIASTLAVSKKRDEPQHPDNSDGEFINPPKYIIGVHDEDNNKQFSLGTTENITWKWRIEHPYHTYKLSLYYWSVLDEDQPDSETLYVKSDTDRDQDYFMFSVDAGKYDHSSEGVYWFALQRTYPENDTEIGDFDTEFSSHDFNITNSKPSNHSSKPTSAPVGDSKKNNTLPLALGIGLGVGLLLLLGLSVFFGLQVLRAHRAKKAQQDHPTPDAAQQGDQASPFPSKMEETISQNPYFATPTSASPAELPSPDPGTKPVSEIG